MRALLLLLLALSACQQMPPPGPSAIAWPLKTETSTEVTVFPVFDAGTALGRNELTYALGDEYPKDVVIVPKEGVVCDFATGKLTWNSIISVDGTAATATLVEGALKLTLVEEGILTVFLAGSIDQQPCPNGQTVVPITHRIVVTVHQVASFLVTQVQLAGCEQPVLPTDAELYPPSVRPVGVNGIQFLAANAPNPAEVKLNSEAALTLKGNFFTAAPSHVTISLATTLPVNGLDSFDVVGPADVTSIAATLKLRKTAGDDSFDSEDLVDDRNYELFFPEKFNSVDLRVNGVVTGAGRLCARMPRSWIDVTSSTPGQCAKTSEGEPSGNEVPVAKIMAAGECRVRIWVPKTSASWDTHFTTSRP